MTNTVEELKEIEAKKRELSKKQREIKKKLEETSELRSEVRRVQAECRSETSKIKSKLKGAVSDIYNTYSNGSVEDLHSLADELMEYASELSSKVRAFAEAKAKLENV